MLPDAVLGEVFGASASGAVSVGTSVGLVVSVEPVGEVSSSTGGVVPASESSDSLVSGALVPGVVVVGEVGDSSGDVGESGAPGSEVAVVDVSSSPSESPSGESGSSSASVIDSGPESVRG